MRFILWISSISDNKFSISVDKSGVDRSGLIVSSMVGLYELYKIS